jgi:hypothetical protein
MVPESPLTQQELPDWEIPMELPISDRGVTLVRDEMADLEFPNQRSHDATRHRF